MLAHPTMPCAHEFRMEVESVSACSPSHPPTAPRPPPSTHVCSHTRHKYDTHVLVILHPISPHRNRPLGTSIEPTPPSPGPPARHSTPCCCVLEDYAYPISYLTASAPPGASINPMLLLTKRLRLAVSMHTYMQAPPSTPCCGRRSYQPSPAAACC